MATDPLSLAFIGCFLIGLLFLLMASFTGHGATHHMGGTGHVHLLHPGGHGGTPHSVAHHGPSTVQTQEHTQLKQGGSLSLLGYLNPMSLALFLLGFGFLGYVFHSALASLALQFTFAIAGVGGFVLALCFLALLRRIFGESQGATVQDVVDRTGLLGKVIMAIPHNSIGEITYVSPGGMRKSVPARSVDGQRLECEQEVVVVNYQHGIAEVDTWEHFVHQQETDIAQGSQAHELSISPVLPEKLDKDGAAHSLREQLQKE